MPCGRAHHLLPTGKCLKANEVMPDSSSIRRPLYPALEPYRTGFLPVGDGHTIHFEESGNPAGVPVFGLHGGPGGGISADMRRFFDPHRWRIILADQRGCGRSTPYAGLEGNTTWDLVADIERLRTHLGLNRIALFGGSWGSTLALAHAVKHPDAVSAIILRGIFLVTRSEVSWFYQEGASRVFPDAFERYASVIPPDEQGDLLSAFSRRLNATDRRERMRAARAWARWEGDTLSLRGPDARPVRFDDDRFIEAFARIECHYFTNGGFMPSDGWLLDQAGKLKGIPGAIVHGRYDMVTPVSSAWTLKKAWPEAELEIVGDAGHASLEPGIIDGLVRATDRMADTLTAQPR
jgi:proline iminopeptidase